MISKNKIKFLRSLQIKKNREKLSLFTVEGEKMVHELLLECPEKIEGIYTVDKKWIDKAQAIECDKNITDEAHMKQISGLSTPQSVLAVVKQPTPPPLESIDTSQAFIIALDRIQDPGNLGTIIRLADWFGADAIICSPDTADCFNPKVTQSTMGSIFRVPIYYHSLPEFLSRIKGIIHTYGAFLKGANIYKQALNLPAVLVMGNESKGISSEVANYIDIQVTIPSFSKGRFGAESLNVAMATSVLCSEFRRK